MPELSAACLDPAYVMKHATRGGSASLRHYNCLTAISSEDLDPRPSLTPPTPGLLLATVRALQGTPGHSRALQGAPGRSRTFRGAKRRILKHQRRMARIRKRLAEPQDPVQLCPRCGSPEGCYAD
jgi:hypothetical protein